MTDSGEIQKFLSDIFEFVLSENFYYLFSNMIQMHRKLSYIEDLRQGIR